MFAVDLIKLHSQIAILDWLINHYLKQSIIFALFVVIVMFIMIFYYICSNHKKILMDISMDITKVKTIK